VEESSDDLAVGIAAAVRAVAPDGVSVGARCITPDDERMLRGHEHTAVRSVLAGRRSEFATGRVLLRQVIGRDVAIPVGSDRRPQLPPGVVASLAHDDRVAVAAATAVTTAAALGIDIEPMSALTPAELAIVRRPDDSDVEPIAVFVAKEAAYKAWSSLGGGLIDHHALRLRADGDHFVVDVVDDEGFSLPGRFARGHGRWIALVVVTDPKLTIAHRTRPRRLGPAMPPDRR